MQEYQGDAVSRRLRMSIVIGGVSLASFLSFASAEANDGAAYTTFDPPGSISTYAECMSDNGIIAGNYYDSSNVSHGFVRATDGTITPFDPTGSIDTETGSVRCVTPKGWIAGSYKDASQVWHGYLRAPHGKITTFDPKGWNGTYPSGINSDRTVVGTYLDDKGRSFAFFRTPDGTITSFHRGSASEINRRGDILGEISNDGYYEGFVRSPGGKYRRFLGVIPYDINDGGYVTGVVPSQPPLMCSASFVWAPDGKLTEFSPDRHSCNSAGNCINKEGLVAGIFGGIGGGHGYIRSAKGTVRRFDPPGSTDTFVTGCDGTGTVAGYYLDSANVYHGYLRSKDK